MENTARIDADRAARRTGRHIELDDGIYALLTYEKRAGENCNDDLVDLCLGGARRLHAL